MLKAPMCIGQNINPELETQNVLSFKNERKGPCIYFEKKLLSTKVLTRLLSSKMVLLTCNYIVLKYLNALDNLRKDSKNIWILAKNSFGCTFGVGG